MAESSDRNLMDIRIPAGLTLAGLVAGLVVGTLVGDSRALGPVTAVAAPVGKLWLQALQMTIIPLVASLLVLGIGKLVLATSAGRAARRTLGWMFAVLVFGGVSTCVFMPMLLAAFPIPAGAGGLLMTGNTAEAGPVPGIGDFVVSLVAPNIVAAAAETMMLPLTIFFALMAIAIVRLPIRQRETLLDVFHALANTMLVMVGWVLKVAPVGVFALAIGVGVEGSGGGALSTLGHYIATVTAMGTIVFVAGYVLAWFAGGRSPVGPSLSSGSM